jgi:outer membrane receptor protein involved in Fe transport
VALLLALPSVADERTPFVGQTLVEAIARLEAAGLPVLYSSDLVRPDMRVLSEPTTRWPREILDQILAPHGLAAQSGPAGTTLIVAAPRPGSIHGVVVLAGTGQPLPDVRVSAADRALSAVTDRAGRFALGPLPDGRYRLELEQSGFAPQRRDAVDVRSGSATEVRFELDPRRARVEKVIVHGGEPQAHAAGIEPSRSIDGDDLRVSPDLGSDPLRAVERLPGVAENETLGALHVRGAGANETGIVLDGLELALPFHMLDRGGLVSAVDTRNVRGVALLDGALPAEYGGPLAGAVEMDTIVPDERIGANVSYTSHDAQVAGSGRFDTGDGYWLVSARRGDPSELLEALHADPGYHPEFWDGFVKTGARLGPRTSIFADFLRSHETLGGDDRARVATLYDPGTFRSVHGGTYGWLTIENTWSPRWVTRTRLSLERVASEREGQSARVDFVDDQRSAEELGFAHQAWLDTGKHLVKYGVSLERLAGSYRYRSEVRSLDLNPQGEALGAYASDRIHVTPALDVEIGLRWDERTDLPGSGTTAPRLNLSYALTPRTTLLGGWGHLALLPRIHELDVEDGVETFDPVQHAEHRVLGIAHTFSDGTRIDLLAYQKIVDDPAPRFENLLDPAGFLPEAAPDRTEIDPTRGRAEGIELSGHGPVGRAFAWRASYALARAEDRIDDAWVARSWDQRHALDVGLVWRPDRRWEASFGGAYHSGQPTTPVLGLAPEDGSPILGPRNSIRLPDYLRLDARVGRHFHVRSSAWTAFVGVTNLLDRENACCLAGVTPNAEPVLRPGLPRMFSAGLTVAF